MKVFYNMAPSSNGQDTSLSRKKFRFDSVQGYENDDKVGSKNKTKSEVKT